MTRTELLQWCQDNMIDAQKQYIKWKKEFDKLNEELIEEEFSN